LLIVPSFTRYDRIDRLEQPLDRLDDEAIARWVEDRLSASLRAYLHVELTDRRQEEALATDPVCRMRLAKDRAAAHIDHRGRRYYFCATSCRDEFAAEPERFIQSDPER
jgi:Cu+-exporting ATPase